MERCFIRASEVEDGANDYLVVDVTTTPQEFIPLPVDISLPARKIKSSPYLKRKPLLIVAESYKRHAMLSLCSELIQSGFSSPKILIRDTYPGDREAPIREVSPEDFIVEAANLGVAVLALSEEVAAKLEGFGVPALALVGDVDSQAALSGELASFSKGYIPIFLVGDSKAQESLTKYPILHPLSSVFIVRGGIDAIGNSLKFSALHSLQRSNNGEALSCAR
ncbi:hypothetical protein KUV22_04360 [Microbulbifer agarilyticus]|uniref:hypothetical protein n=1 Tax=Microbulbifer agarilyticus TaxID=260552 RepID=UPI001C96D5D3|nr:hypothetical protein [Microbulbifer agarilyticus]MBY6189647.1 hypothetical protein [Microbulbifer agarilyticus]